MVMVLIILLMGIWCFPGVAFYERMNVYKQKRKWKRCLLVFLSDPAVWIYVGCSWIGSKGEGVAKWFSE